MTKTLDMSNETLVSGLNYLSQHHDFADSKKWALLWLQKHDPETAARVKDFPDRHFSNRGFVCHLISKGFKADQELIEKLFAFFRAMIHYKPAGPELKDPAAPKKKVVTVPGLELISDIEDGVDAILSDIDPVEIKFPVSQVDLLAAKTWLENEVLDAHEQVQKWTAILQLLETSYARVGGIVAKLRPAKKPVKPAKAQEIAHKDLSKLLKNITYLKDFPELKIHSISPMRILGAKQLLVYNTKYKQAGLYIAEKGGALTLSGSSIRGYDQIASYKKTLRHPDEFFKNSDLYAALAALQTKKSPISSHIADVTVLLDAKK